MNLYELNSFVILSETLHFAKTAEEINISPSALSRIITRLEEECGTDLIDRSNRKVELTPNGKRFAEFAKETIDSFAEIKGEFSGENKITGTLHVYASVTACYLILPKFIKKLSEKFPGIQLAVETGDPAGAIAAIREGRADLAVAAIPEDGLSYLETIPMRKTPLIFAESSASNFNFDDSSSPQDFISSVPLILPKTGLARKRFDQWTKSRNVKPIIAAETEGNEAILALAQLGLGMGLVPQIVLESGRYATNFKIHSAKNIMGYYDIGFIRRSEIYGTQSSRRIQMAVSDILRDF